MYQISDILHDSSWSHKLLIKCWAYCHFELFAEDLKSSWATDWSNQTVTLSGHNWLVDRNKSGLWITGKIAKEGSNDNFGLFFTKSKGETFIYEK